MSRARPQHSPRHEPVAGRRRLRRLLLAAALCALAAGHGARSAGGQGPRFGLTSSSKSVTLCPGQTVPVRLSVDGPRADAFTYRWRAEAGLLKSDGPDAVWDLSGVKPGAYAVSVTVTISSHIAGTQSVVRKAEVVVHECREVPPQPTCPVIKLDCPKSVEEGVSVTLTASLTGGGQPREKVSFGWKVSAGAASSSEARRVRVDTSGLGGQFILARFEVHGYGIPCAEGCRTFVDPRPTPSPSATPSPSPSPGGPALTSSPTPAATPSPTASPPPTPHASPTLGASPPPPVPAEISRAAGARSSLWPTLLLISLAALGLVCLLFILLLTLRHFSPTGWGRFVALVKFRLGVRRDADLGAELDEEALAGVVLGGGTDEVRCSIYAPSQAAPAEGFLVQVFAHTAADASRLEGLAREAQQNAERRGARGVGAIERGVELGFHLHLPGLEVDEPSQSIIWRGELEAVQFGVSVPEDFRPRAVNCKLTVTGGSVPLGHIRFNLKVTGGAAPRPSDDDAPLACHRYFNRYRRAFISYASEDRAEVLRRVQMLNLLKIECFQDLVSLKPGQRWREELYRYIAVSDVFFLFWSAAASKSEWVEKEVRYALNCKAEKDDNPPEIVPVILEGPPEVPPPDYLPELHFNDPFASFIKAASVRTESGNG